MPTSFRQLNGAPVSFFSFIDIITGVSGILILITLLLTTTINPTTAEDGFSNDEEDPALKAKLESVIDELDRLNTDNQRLQSLLLEASKSPNKAALQDDMDDLSRQIRDLQLKIAAKQKQLRSLQQQSAQRDQQLGLTALIQQIEQLKEQVKALQEESKKLMRQVAELETAVREAQARLLKINSEQNRLWVIPEPSRTTKEPLLIVVSSRSVTIDRFDKPDARIALDDVDSASEFRDKMKVYNPVNQYIVFFVKPSGIAAFETLRKEAKRIGYEVGYDPLDENAQVIFSKSDKDKP